MDVYEIITKKIIEQLEAGAIPWRKPWVGGAAGMPRNFSSTKEYRGVNVFLLSYAQAQGGFRSPFWLTYKQAQELGGQVRGGEKSPTPVVFYKTYDRAPRDGEDGEGRKAWVLRYTSVFNVDQCDGLTVPDLGAGPKFEHEIIAAAQALVDGMPNKPIIENSRESARAFYAPSLDKVVVPYLAQFPKAEEFYSTLFHELGHSTGHAKRIGRDLQNGFGNHEYSKEELVAEFTASFLCGVSGIESRTLENSSAYIEGWLSRLRDKESRKWIPWAASQAQKAADYIRNINVENVKAAA